MSLVSSILSHHTSSMYIVTVQFVPPEALFLDDSESAGNRSVSNNFVLGSSVPAEHNLDNEEEIARELRRRYASRTTTLFPLRQEAMFSLAVKVCVSSHYAPPNSQLIGLL